MKLLIITQAIDKNNPVLSFFHRWVEEFAKHFEKITVICLEKGSYDLPNNVQVFSLGKETNNLTPYSLLLTSKLKYVWNFYKYIFKFRRDYEAVFVHMNQEYVLLAGDMWHMMGKKVYLWRNHAKGSIFTRMAVMLSHKVFYTSPQSFAARYKKSVQMPVGIDTDFFKPDPSIERIPNSALFLGRIAPVKKVSEFVDWLKTTNYTATIAGPIGDAEYWESVKLKIENSKLKVNYVGPVDQVGALKLYQTHELYVNLTPAGSFDKTIFESASCDTRIKVENRDLEFLNDMSPEELREYVVENHSLHELAKNIHASI